MGILLPLTIISYAKRRELPIFPPGWKTLNFSLENFFWTITVVAKQSPNNKVIDVLEVGTIPVISASLTLGKTNLMSLAFSKILSGFEATPIIFIRYLLAYFNILFNSVVFPEYEKIIRISFFSIWPMSPCKACAGSQKKLGIPTLEKVAEIFLAIKPDLPIPAKITLPLQFKIKSMAFTNDLLKTFLIFFNSFI